MVSVESRIRRIEKNPSPKRLKANVVTTEKLGYRAVTTKTVAPDAITANEAAFGTTVVSPTQPTEYLKEGFTWVNPDDGAANVYSTTLNDFVPVTDANAQLTADGKNTIYAQTAAPTGGTYKTNDIWFDTDDGNKLYTWNGTAWVSVQDTAISAAAQAATAAQNTADGKNKVYRQTTEPTGGTYAEGDLWFDTDDNNKIYRRTSNAWTAVQLGGSALANINANSITAGSIDASVITVSNINAANISTGTLSADRIAANSLDVNKLTAGTLRAGTVYAGDIAASQITAGTISASITITSPTITGATITGGTIRTANSGTRIELTSSASNRIDFYGTGTTQGLISVNGYRMFMYAPASTLAGGAVLSLYGDESPSTPGGAFITAGPTLGLTFAMSSTTISMNQGTYGIRVSANGVIVDGAAGETTSALRNVRITQTAPSSGSDSSTYANGSILLVREA